MDLFTDEYFMREAFKEAKKAFDIGEVPVGAVVVCKNKIIARAHNQTEKLTDATAHAEMLATTAAANYLGSKYLSECTLFVTLEPCVMCAGCLALDTITEVSVWRFRCSARIYAGGQPYSSSEDGSCNGHDGS